MVTIRNVKFEFIYFYQQSISCTKFNSEEDPRLKVISQFIKNNEAYVCDILSLFHYISNYNLHLAVFEQCPI